MDELACIALEDTLPVSKPTISYHLKILRDAGLISTRKEGRNCYYSLRRNVIEGLIDDLWELAPAPGAVIGGKKDSAPVGRVTGRRDPADVAAVPRHRAMSDGVAEEAILTW